MIGRSLIVGLALLWSAGAQPLAAAGEDPDWPCVQRLVPSWSQLAGDDRIVLE